MMTNWTQKKQLMSIACATGLVCSADEGLLHHSYILVPSVRVTCTSV